MQINQVSYQKTFNLGNYSSERIGVEVVLSEGEDAKEALNTAKALVEEYHQQSSLMYSLPSNDIVRHPFPEILVEKEVREQTLEEQIMSCEDIKVLESYKFIAKKDPSLQLAYDKKMYILKLENKKP